MNLKLIGPFGASGSGERKDCTHTFLALKPHARQNLSAKGCLKMLPALRNKGAYWQQIKVS